ncbi:MAG: SDR family NAD(P)-dependent oxidoreductase [Cyanobacteria bacterium P01_F01_bin.143]
MVFNSLSGEFIDRSLSILKDDGHFIEIGKRDIRSTEEIAQIKPNVSYSLVDLFSTAQQQPNVIQSLLTKLIARFATAELKPLPYKEFSLEETISAFQYMQKAKHIGKIVVTHDNPVEINDRSTLQIDEDKTYLIAGGLGDLGLLVANWLVEKGAKHLLLIGRNQPSEYAQQQISQLEQKQVNVTIAQADIANYDSLQQIIGRKPCAPTTSAPLPPLGGIIHSAGTLDDGMLINMDSERMATVMNPKVLGAWNLHQLTKDMPLDFFILFSSAASLLGSPGQTNHVVANTFLDTLAHYRQAQGLPGLSLNWGAWSDIGEAARRKADRQMNLKGIGSIAPQEGLAILEKLFNQSSPQVGIVPIDWSRFIAAGYNLPLVEDFKQIKQTSEISTSSSNFLTELQAINPEHQLKFLITFLQKEVGKVLGLSANQLPSVSQGFFDIGMDSLMAIELKNKLENNLQATISSTVIFEHSNIEQLANYIFDEVLHLEAPKAESAETVETELSPEELEDAIAQELADLESLL